MHEAPRARSVLMTADTVGGVWTYAIELAAALARAGVRTTIATMGEAMRPAQRAQAERVPRLEVIESRFRLEWMDDPWRDVARAGEWLLGLEKKLAPDVVQVNGWAHGALRWRAPAIVVAHSCVASWWRAVHGEDPPERYARYRVEVARGVAHAAAVVAPTRAMGRTVVALHGAPRRLEVIPNGRDPSRFAPAPHKEPFVFASGRLWDPAKNLAALEEAARVAAWPIRVAGSDEHPSGARRKPRFAIGMGWLDEDAIARQLGRAAIFASPARYEPFGLSALEAALSGCALVLGDVPTLREVWSDAALFVDPGDARALAAAIDVLAGDEPKRAAMAARARGRALAYSPERMAAAYLALYRDVASPRAAPRPWSPEPCA